MKSTTKNAKELLKLRNLLNYEIDNDKLDYFKRDIKCYRNEINNAKNKGETNKGESEEHCKGILNKFLLNAFGYNCNTKGKIDLVIKYDDAVKTIIETKNYDNEEEMIKDNDYFHKGFYQTILYYYKSRKNKDNKDFNIDNIIITNFEKVYLFSKYDFEKIINDNQIVNYFNENSKVKNDTFYKICGGFLENINLEVVGYKIDLFNDDDALIYRFFNPYNICSVKLGNDINSISNTFYKEIIYMMGLEEDKEKKLRLSNVDNSLIRLTMDVIKNSSDKTNENEIFDEALKINIIWVNRILFLKILEAQLRTFRNDKHLDILNPFKIKDYNYLYTLFFNVLAKPKNMRSSSNDYNYIPYLNSSLFEEGKDELIFSITKLNNESKMKIMSGSILYNDRDFNSSQLTFLEYILRFLNCYVFNADAKNVDKNTIIKSSVLGLVFERLNGYKDGSHFTPPAITMYMARYSIEKIIIEKFNKYFTDTHFQNINEVKNYVRANIHIYRDNIKNILDSIKIIDPACGSGHFLVACLNELIRIKSEFRVLHDNIEINISEDELVINYIDGTHFKYNIENDNITDRKQEIEKTLFEAKEHIISNQLYGVDINANSVNICRLRLWIELLKSSYYTDIKSDEKFIDLEILPNLEFKIVSANSLIELDDKEVILISSTWDKQELIKNMREYFNASYENKSRIRKEILRLIKEYSNHNSKLENYNPFDMLKSYDFFDSGLMFGIDKFDLVIGNPPYVFVKYVDWADDVKDYFSSNYDITNKDNKSKSNQSGKINLYTLFIFRAIKLLKENGLFSFIVPNGLLRTTTYDMARKFILDNYHIDLIADLKDGVFKGVTAPTIIFKFSKSHSNDDTKIIDANCLVDGFVNESKCHYINQSIFLENTSYTFSIFSNPKETVLFKKMESYNKYLGEITSEIIEGIVCKKEQILLEKPNDPLCRKFLEGKNIKKYKIDFNNKYIIFDRKKLHRARPDEVWNSDKKIIIQRISGGLHPIVAALDTENYYSFASTNLILIRDDFRDIYSYELICALLNSKLINFYYVKNFTNASTLTVNISKTFLEKIPLPLIDLNNKEDKEVHDKIVTLVDNIIALNKNLSVEKNPNSITMLNRQINAVDKQIDALVYKLYNLNDEEIKIIEGE